ncbi:uncharacterized protein LOC135209517 [Macrobrachium nipponense]|uniref:uncharacterized protein LOC135209517 n=1 Tax=Macrobrachium nipponense TaxID=159736 RepID=UPI0030C89ACD
MLCCWSAGAGPAGAGPAAAGPAGAGPAAAGPDGAGPAAAGPDGAGPAVDVPATPAVPAPAHVASRHGVDNLEEKAQFNVQEFLAAPSIQFCLKTTQSRAQWSALAEACSGYVLLLEKSLTGDSIILKGIGGEEVTPICRLHLSCELVTGNVDFAVKNSLAVEGGSEVSHSADQEEISQEDEEDGDEEEEPDVPEETPSSQSVAEDSSETTAAELTDIENSTLEVGQVAPSIQVLSETTLTKAPWSALAVAYGGYVSTSMVKAQIRYIAMESLISSGSITDEDELELAQELLNVARADLINKIGQEEIAADNADVESTSAYELG